MGIKIESPILALSKKNQNKKCYNWGYWTWLCGAPISLRDRQ